jgi:hypothetical protein
MKIRMGDRVRIRETVTFPITDVTFEADHEGRVTGMQWEGDPKDILGVQVDGRGGLIGIDLIELLTGGSDGI